MDREIKISIVSSQYDFDMVMNLRRKVFVEEMGIDEKLEFDGNDFSATQIYAKLNGKAVACLRIRYFGNFAKFERMALLPEFRKTTLATEVMNYGFELVAKKGFKFVRAACEKELLPRWEELGFKKSNLAPIKINHNMVIFPIEKNLSQPNKQINLNSHLAEITQKEEKIIGEKKYPLSNLFVPLFVNKNKKHLT